MRTESPIKPRNRAGLFGDKIEKDVSTEEALKVLDQWLKAKWEEKE
jgi:hypothetical protein